MGDWLSSMQDIAGPALSLGGTMMGGPAGGTLGGLAGGMLGGGEEASSSAEARVTTTVGAGAWDISFGGRSNLLLIAAGAAAIYFLFIKGK